MNKKNYIVVPDIHGRYDLLKMVLDYVYKTWPEGIKVIFLGDYIDRGTENVKVLDAVMNPKENFEFVTLMGNHENMVITDNVYDPKCILELHKSEKGIQFYIDWMKELPYFHWEGLNVFAHATYDATLPPKQQNLDMVIWQRYSDYEDWQANIPEGQQRYFLTHGHTPKQNGPILAINRLNLDVGAVFTGKMVIAIFDYDKIGPQKFEEFYIVPDG